MDDEDVGFRCAASGVQLMIIHMKTGVIMTYRWLINHIILPVWVAGTANDMNKAFRSTIGVCSLFLILGNCVLTDNNIKESPRAIAITNVNLIPMTHETIQKDHTVLVSNARIIEIGPSRNVDVPPGTLIVNGEDAYLIPGLADMHMHTDESWLSEVRPVSPLSLYLANGVTTIRCFGPVGKSPRYVLRWRDEIKNGKRLGPVIYSAGPVLNSPLDDPKKTVHAQYTSGFDFIKPYSYLSRGDFHEIMVAAKDLGMYVAGHIPMAVGLDGVLAEGMDEIAHVEELAWELIEFDRGLVLKPQEWIPYVVGRITQKYSTAEGFSIEKVERLIEPTAIQIAEKLKAADLSVDTTLVVSEIIIRKLFESDAFMKRPENRYLPRWYFDSYYNGYEIHQVQFKGLEHISRLKFAVDRILLRTLHEAGVRLLLGTDAGTGGMGIVPGFSIHDELRILVENGLTPYEALVTGTTNAAAVIEKMTGTRDFGTIEIGHRADLILLDDNPLEDIAHLRKLRGVMAAGQWHSKESLESMITLDQPFPTAGSEVESQWLSSEVVFDGKITTRKEWSDVVSLELILFEYHRGPSLISSRWWIRNDAKWLYLLVRIPVSHLEVYAAYISYFWPYPNPFTHSDLGVVLTDGTAWDACEYVEGQWHGDIVTSPLGQNNVVGAATADDNFFWFEMKKALNSGDGCDMSWIPGETVGLGRTGVLWLGISTPSSYFEHPVVLHLAAGDPE